MNRLVSMSVYGKERMYIDGAVKNAKLMNKIYPGWKMVVYCEKGTDESVIKALRDLGVKIVVMRTSFIHSGMLWRFLPAWDPKIDYVIFRDSDSRINVREAAAVQAWIDSGKDAHCMHDHPHHACLPIFGGMWGIKGGVLKGPVPEVMQGKKRLKRVGDMMLLKKLILPLIINSTLRHSSVPIKDEWGPIEPFPDHEEFEGFVGQQYDNQGSPIWA